MFDSSNGRLHRRPSSFALTNFRLLDIIDNGWTALITALYLAW